MKCQSYFLGKIRKSITSLSSVEFAYSMVSLNITVQSVMYLHVSMFLPRMGYIIKYRNSI